MYEPGPIGVIVLSFQVSPVPTEKLPDSTVICSLDGCQCGITLYPLGAFRRMVNGPGLLGSPSSTASLAPGGRVLGAGPHWTSVPFIMRAPAILLSFFQNWPEARPQSASTRIKSRFLFINSFFSSRCTDPETKCFCWGADCKPSQAWRDRKRAQPELRPCQMTITSFMAHGRVAGAGPSLRSG